MNPKMRDHHKDQLLQALMHYLPMDVRGKVMAEVPAAYNDYCGREIVVTTNPSDREEVEAMVDRLIAERNSAICERDTVQVEADRTAHSLNERDAELADLRREFEALGDERDELQDETKGIGECAAGWLRDYRKQAAELAEARAAILALRGEVSG